jgi:hypothetical protein
MKRVAASLVFAWLRSLASMRILLWGVAISACGGILATPDDAETVADAQAPSLFGDPDVAVVHAAVACVPCRASRDCDSPQVGCVASEGSLYCAPGCSKEGFCAADRTCTWVSDPAGVTWHACLPYANPCAADAEAGLPVRPMPRQR